MKKIELYTFTYNDQPLLPFFLEYYASIVDRMIFIDNGSTDKTLDILKAYNSILNIKVIKTGMTWWNWDETLKIRNEIWKDSKCDLIFFIDLDEFLYRENLREFLEYNDFDIYQTKGYNMVSEHFPKNGTNILNIKLGVPIALLNKYAIWKSSIKIISLDAHSIAKTTATICRFDIKLLHYKFLGAEIMAKRAKDIKDRVPPTSYCKGIRGNILQKYPGFVKTKDEYKREIAQMLREAKPVI